MSEANHESIFPFYIPEQMHKKVKSWTQDLGRSGGKIGIRHHIWPRSSTPSEWICVHRPHRVLAVTRAPWLTRSPRGRSHQPLAECPTLRRHIPWVNGKHYLLWGNATKLSQMKHRRFGWHLGGKSQSLSELETDGRWGSGMTQFNSLKHVYCFNISDGLKEKQNTHLVIKKTLVLSVKSIGKKFGWTRSSSFSFTYLSKLC